MPKCSLSWNYAVCAVSLVLIDLALFCLSRGGGGPSHRIGDCRHTTRLNICTAGSLIHIMNDRMSGFDAHDVVRVFEPVLSAVAFLHGQQPPIIHRDLKVIRGLNVVF